MNKPPSQRIIPALELLAPKLLALGADVYWETDTSLRIQNIVSTTDAPLDDVQALLGTRLDQLPSPPPMLVATLRTPLTALSRLQSFRGLYCRLHDDSQRGFVLHGEPKTDPVAGFGGYFGIARDITAEWQELERARDTQALLANAIENVSDGCALFDVDDRLIYSNSTWRDYINAEIAPLIEPGITFERIMQLNLQYGLAAEGIGREDDWLQERLTRHRGGKHIFLQYAAEHQWLLVRDYPTDSGGRLIITSDITQLKQREQALAESEERYALAMRGANEGLWDWRVGADQVHVSAHACAILGFSASSTIPLKDWLACLHPADRKLWRRRFIDHLKGVSAFFECELRVRHQNGDYRWVYIHGLGLRDASEQGRGRIYRIAGSIGDTTERRHLQDKARQQELQLIQANKMTALGTLVAGAAHEINNPNNLIAMNADLLLAIWQDAGSILDEYAILNEDFLLGGLPYAEIRDEIPVLLTDVRTSARRIEKIIADLKSFAQPRQNPLHTTVALNGVVQSATRLLAHMIRAKTDHFTLTLAAALPAISGDAQRLEQIVVNLLVNALEALPASAQGVTVQTCYEAATKRVELIVQDGGIGIAPEHLDRICEPFFSTKLASGGTGLGLAITYTLVKEHQGELTFTSKPGHGTQVVVAFPVLSET